MIKFMLKAIKRVINDNSKLAPYLHILKQNNPHKLRRLVYDQSDHNTLALQQQNHILLFLEKYIPTFNPISNIALIWEFIVFLSIMYYYIEMGIVLTYGQIVWNQQLANPVTLTIDIITIIIFGIDILFRMSCGYIYKGIIIMNRNRIISKYFRGELVLDVISVVMLILVMNAQNYMYNFGKLWLVFKILRCYQIDDNFMRRLYLNKIGKTIYVIGKLMTLLLLVSHIIGVIFYAMDNYFLTSGYYQPQFTWLTSSTAYTPISSLGWPLQYMYSLYWGVNQVTNISYGDIAPSNPIQTVYVIPIMCMGFVLYSYATANMIRVIIWARSHRAVQIKQTVEIQNYMKNLNVRLDVRERVLVSLQQTYQHEGERDYTLENQMKSKLPHHLQREVVKQLYRGFYFSLIDIFFSEEITQALFDVNERKYGMSQVIIEKGMRPSHLYFISKGKLFNQLLLTNTGVLLGELTSNTLFGQYQLFTKKQYVYQCKTASISTIYEISFNQLFKTIRSSPYLKEKLQLITQQIIFNKAYQMIQYECYFCGNNHHFIQCPQRFPQFQYPSKQPIETIDNSKRRYDRVRMKALKLKLHCSNNKEIKSQVDVNILTKIHSRVKKIKKRVQLIYDLFQIDSAFDWNIFYPNFNLAKVKQLWNLSNYNKKLSFSNLSLQ